MLAPEEVYKSAGIVKGEGELTPDERKRRRAAKKRKRKGQRICHVILSEAFYLLFLNITSLLLDIILLELIM